MRLLPAVRAVSVDFYRHLMAAYFRKPASLPGVIPHLHSIYGIFEDFEEETKNMAEKPNNMTIRMDDELLARVDDWAGRSDRKSVV